MLPRSGIGTLGHRMLAGSSRSAFTRLTALCNTVMKATLLGIVSLLLETCCMNSSSTAEDGGCLLIMRVLGIYQNWTYPKLLLLHCLLILFVKMLNTQNFTQAIWKHIVMFCGAATDITHTV